jgi:hypothetical protein
MKIEAQYKPIQSSVWTATALAPREYFEPPTEARLHDWNDLPRHAHTADFLDAKHTGQFETELRIYEPDGQLRVAMSEVFWDGRQNKIILRTEAELEIAIVQVRSLENPPSWRTFRVNRHADGRMLFEDLNIHETKEQQVLGPTKVLSLPRVAEKYPTDKCVCLRFRRVNSDVWQIQELTSAQEIGLRNRLESLVEPAAGQRLADHLPIAAEQVAEIEGWLVKQKGQPDFKFWEVLWNNGRNWIGICVDERRTLRSLRLHADPQLTLRFLRRLDSSAVIESDPGSSES